MEEKILDKIRKLHRHAESARNIGSEAEAQAFAQMVNQLLNKHRLELTDIQFEEQRRNEPVTEAEIDFRKYGDTYRGKPVEWKFKRQRIEWIERLADIVARAHSCQILIMDKTNRLFLAGTETNRQIAEYVLITLMRAAEKLSWDEYAKYFYKCRDELGDVTLARGFRHAWLISFIHRIHERFQEEKAKMNQDKTGTALVRYDRERADIDEFLKDRKHGKPLPAKAIHNVAGILAGRKRADEMNLDANAVRDGKDVKELEDKLLEVAVVEPVGKNADQETIYELRQWKGNKIYCRGPLHSVFEQAERMWPGHVRRQADNKMAAKYRILN